MRYWFAVLVLSLCHIAYSWWDSSSSTVIDKRSMTCYCVSSCKVTSTCTYDCNNGCGSRRRNLPGIPKDSSILLLPCKYEAWDLNKDGFVNVDEFAFTGHAKVEDRKTQQLFNKIDVNGDGRLTRKELNSAPLVRERC